MQVTQDQLVYKLNSNDKTAEVIGIKNGKEEITIPRSIKYENQEYIIIRIGKNSFKSSYKIKSIRFHPDSEVKIIDDEAFYESKIVSISIPPSLRKIGKRSFTFCEDLTKFEIPINSELKEIGKYAFSNTSIQSLSIPSNIEELRKCWCLHTSKLNDVKIIPREQQNIKYFGENDMFIIKKSDINSDNYDALVYVRRSLKKVKIPSFIKFISSCAFTYSKIESIFIPSQILEICDSAFCTCEMLKVVDFQENSQLRLIDKYAFSQTSIKKIFIPQKVGKIDNYAFSFTDSIKFVDFSSNSMVQEIGSHCFDSSCLRSFSVPSNVKEIDQTFLRNVKLEIIEFDENNSWELVCEVTSEFNENTIILVPVQVSQYCL